MADGYGKCIGSIFGQRPGGMQQQTHHMLNLRLIRPPKANYGLLDLSGRIGAHPQAAITTGGYQSATGLT